MNYFKTTSMSLIALSMLSVSDLVQSKNTYQIQESKHNLKDPGMTHNVDATYSCGFYFYETDEDKIGIDMDVFWEIGTEHL